jgi:hypothetical protein
MVGHPARAGAAGESSDASAEPTAGSSESVERQAATVDAQDENIVFARSEHPVGPMAFGRWNRTASEKEPRRGSKPRKDGVGRVAGNQSHRLPGCDGEDEAQ